MKHIRQCIPHFLTICILMQLLLAACGGTPATSDEPIHLTLAVYQNNYLPIVEAFNESQSEYYIEIVDYSDDSTVSRHTALTRLNTELASGEGPDLFYLWNLQMDVEVYGPKGYLEDLYPYLEQDPDLSKDDLIPSFLNAYSVGDKLYGAVPGFGIISMFGPTSVLEQFNTWNFDALNQLAEECGGMQELFSTQQTGLSFLQSALTTSLSDFVDYQQATASFDGQEFAEVLKMCAQLEGSPNGDETPQHPLLTYYVIQSFMELQYYEAFYGDSITFVGIPSETSSGNCFVNMMDQFAMNHNSKYKDGAWQFLRILFTESYQYDAYVNSGYTCFPTNQAAMERLIEKSMSTLTTIDENGQEVEVTARGNQTDFEYHAATESQVQQILDVIDHTDVVAHAVSEILTIAEEESSYYFRGEKSLEETQRIIQQRVTVYLGEQQ